MRTLTKEQLDRLPTPTPAPESEDLDDLRLAVADLPGTHQEAIRLCYYERLNLAEIGDRLGVPGSDAVLILADALVRLRRLMGAA